MFGEESIKYFEQDLVTIPLEGKRPFLKNWQSTTIDNYNLSLADDYPDANIGMLLGKCQNIIALDIDREDALDLCPPSPVRKKGKKGETRFFRYNGEKNVKRHDLGIELLSDGSQTVMPPSIHPDTGKPYRWITPDILPEFDVKDLPILENTFLLMLKNNPIKKDVVGRHNTLIKHLGGKIKDGVPRDQAIQDILIYDQIHHSENPYFSDESEPHGGSGEAAARAMYNSIATTAKRKGEYIDASQSQRPEKASILAKSVSIKKYKKLPRLDGVLGMLFSDYYDNAIIPRTQYSFMVAMQTVSIMIGNKCHLEGVGANLFQYGIGPTSSGKDFPFKRCQEYVHEIDPQLMGPMSPTSETLIMKCLSKNREQAIFTDEAESFLAKIKDDRMNMGLRQIITQLYNTIGRQQTPKKISKQNSEEVHTFGEVFSPYLNMLLLSTDTGFEKYCDMDFFNLGLGSRMLFFMENRLRKPIKRKYVPLNDEIVQALEQIRCPAGHSSIAVDLTETKNKIEITALKATNKGQEIIHSVFDEYGNDSIDPDKQKFRGILSRRIENFYKYAIIHHASRYPSGYLFEEVGSQSFIFARDAIEAITHNMIVGLDQSVASSRNELLQNKFLEYINAGPKKKKQISANFRKIDRRLRDEVLLELKEQDLIAIDQEGNFFAT